MFPNYDAGCKGKPTANHFYSFVDINLQIKEIEMATREQTQYRDTNKGQFLKKIRC
jgi:uncharacterized ubiquitin-like protein YukD